jgi:hypothetical protein
MKEKDLKVIRIKCYLINARFKIEIISVLQGSVICKISLLFRNKYSIKYMCDNKIFKFQKQETLMLY